MPEILLTFATEDFVTPGMDDVHRRLAEMCRERGIRAGFHVTGELARSLRNHGRQDVIDALRQHEIGYHGNTHGAYPFLGSVCEDNSWDQTVAEILRTEGPGLLEVTDVFQTEPAYFILEFAKAPQLIHALRLLGIDVIGYSQLPRTGSSPFVWFAGSLCYCGPLGSLELPHDHPDRCQRMLDSANRLLTDARQGVADGIIKLFLHPYKLWYDWREQSWGTGLNDTYKHYPFGLDEWHAPPPHDRATSARLFADFEAILDHIRAQPDVSFIATSQAAARYRKRPAPFVELSELLAAIQGPADTYGPVPVHQAFLSPAEQLGMATWALASYVRTGQLPDAIPFRVLLGPVEPLPVAGAVQCTPFTAFANELQRIDREMDFYGRIPACIDVAGVKVSPGTALAGMAGLLADIARTGRAPEQVQWQPYPAFPVIAQDKYFAETSFTHGDLYPDGFTGQAICEQCRRQSWSYKPAV